MNDVHGHHHEHGEHGHTHGTQAHESPQTVKSLALGALHVGGHDHGPGGHSHVVASGSLTSSARGLWALKWGFCGLGITAVIQAVIYMLSGSTGLLADTIHNFADAGTAIPLGMAFWMQRRVASQRFTYGYHRAEDLAGL